MGNEPTSTCASGREGELICGRNSYPLIAALLTAHLFCPIPGDPCPAWNPATAAFPSSVESPHPPATPRAAPTSPDSRAKATANQAPNQRAPGLSLWAQRGLWELLQPQKLELQGQVWESGVSCLFLSSLLHPLWILGACGSAGVHSTPLQRAFPIFSHRGG